jgi:hypothetical protein
MIFGLPTILRERCFLARLGGAFARRSARRQNTRGDFPVRIFKQSRRKAAANDLSSERPVYEEPAMDRELPLVFLAAVMAAAVLVGMQVQSSSAAQKQEAAAHRAYRTAQHQPDSRLASSQASLSETLGQRVR